MQKRSTSTGTLSRTDYTLPGAVDGQSSRVQWTKKYGALPVIMLLNYTAERACPKLQGIPHDQWTAAREYFVNTSGGGTFEAAHQVLSSLSEMVVYREPWRNTDPPRRYEHLLDSKGAFALSIECVQKGLTAQYQSIQSETSAVSSARIVELPEDIQPMKLEDVTER